MRILSVGTMSGISNTCLHRHWSLKKLADDIDVVNTTVNPISLWYRIAYHLFLYGIPIPIPDNSQANNTIKRYIKEGRNYDVVWIDKGVTINRDTLLYIKKNSPKTKIVSYSPDNMALRHNQSENYLKCIPIYNFHFTTKSYILEELKLLGADKVIFTAQSYESTFHYPRVLNTDDYINLGCDVGFVGMWEQERCDDICYLAQHGIKVRVFGNKKWQLYKNYSKNLIIENHGLYNEEYAKSFKAFKISLCFLRKKNFDLQTSRTMEIPACGGFMLAERTSEHQQLFVEDKEAVFFASKEELLEKCRYYLSHDEERQAIVKAGELRCQTSGYSNLDTMKRLLNIVLETNK